MKYCIAFTSILFVFVSCHRMNKSKNKPLTEFNINYLIQNLEDSKNNQIMVIAHRGDWRNAPENSLQAIKNCIEMKVDIVEIDIRETKDGHLVLMHDETLNRTTNGKGLVKDWTLEDLKKLRLLDGLGLETHHTIPTLEEALIISKDKILINLDKSYAIFDKCHQIMKRTGTLNQVIIKGEKTRNQLENEFGTYLDDVYFMPIVKLPNANAKSIINDYVEHRLPIAFEFIVPSDTISTINYFKEIRNQGSGVWVNSLWADMNAGHNDEKAVDNPQIYDWYIENNIDMIQTDRPELLINYLRKKGLHR